MAAEIKARSALLRARLAMAWLAAAPLAAQAAEFRLPSHEAFYDVRLVRATSAEGPRAVDGTLIHYFADACEGWDTKTLTSLNLTFRDGSTYINERLVSTWESKSGRDYTFNVKTTKNGAPVEFFKGRAAIEDGGGSAVYEGFSDSSRQYTIRLPRGTMLPVAYSRALIARAAAGEPLFSAVIFNGASSVGPRLMSVAIGPRQLPGEAAARRPAALVSGDGALLDHALLDTPSWHMTMALYNLNERRGTPNFELSMQFHESGVSRMIEQDFGNFTVVANLRRLERLDEPACPTS